jgi:putative membrane protein
MSNKPAGFAEDVTNWGRGLCMGAADIVPGVSGGTIALILGHYERLVTAISRVDTKLFRMVTQGQISQAANYLDLRFLVGLFLGIVTGIVGLASLLHYLLEHQQAYIYSVFFGLIVASSYLVARRLRQWQFASFVLLAMGVVVAWQICLLSPVQANLTPMKAFAAATVAICAMILPGISGAFVLLLLGLYFPITELIKGLPRGEVTLDGFVIIIAFGLGCIIGLLAFSRILKWLLAHRHDQTMAFLVGLMLGSLYKIWPFQQVTQATVDLPFKQRAFEHVWPTASGANLALVACLAVAAMLTALALEKIGDRLAQRSGKRVASDT